MKKTLSILFSVLFLGSIIAQEERTLDAFSGVDVSGGINITLEKGNSPRAEIKMIKGDIEDLKLEVRKGVLKINFDSKSNWGWGSNNKADITLYYQDLSMLEASAGSKIYGDQSISANQFEIDVSSGASIKVIVDASYTEADASSGSSITLDGSSDKLDVDVSSGASFRGERFETQEADANASSGASVKLWVNQTLSANASSGGSVKYKGSPKNLDLDSGKYSGGSIKKM